jgi:YqzH-like protein
MDEKLLNKMIRNCFSHYCHDIDIFPLANADYEQLYQKIILEKEKHPDIDLYELINDLVYEYLTK